MAGRDKQRKETKKRSDDEGGNIIIHHAFCTGSKRVHS